MKNTQVHYDEKYEGVLFKQVTREDLKKIFYKNDSTLKFENYITKMKVIFSVLEKYRVFFY